jgi:hypothetical protein
MPEPEQEEQEEVETARTVVAAVELRIALMPLKNQAEAEAIAWALTHTPLAETAVIALTEALHDQWRVFKRHRPVGAYLPVGQLDGDCSCGRGEWPCAELMAVLGLR